jgi:hypothetical protein
MVPTAGIAGRFESGLVNNNPRA